MRRIYLDHAATTPLDARAARAMRPFDAKMFGNPNALYREGVAARRAVEDARTEVAHALGAHPDEIVFVASGTESDNIAIIGVVSAAHEAGIALPHVITTAIEHPAVLAVVQALERQGRIRATYLSVDHDGTILLTELKEALAPDTVLVSVGYANSEIGVIQPVHEVMRVVRAWRKEHNSAYPYVHTDAAQAMNYLDTNIERLGVDLLSFNGSKIYGPKGTGALYKRREVVLASVLYGGDQEQGLRPGTENVAGIVGLARALSLACAVREKESARLAGLQDHFIDRALKEIPDASLNGSRTNRLPNNVHISVPGIDSTELVVRLDAKGVACSAKSACKSSADEVSHVLAALGGVRDEETSGVRFSMGRKTTKADINNTLRALGGIVAVMRGGA